MLDGLALPNQLVVITCVLRAASSVRATPFWKMLLGALLPWGTREGGKVVRFTLDQAYPVKK